MAFFRFFSLRRATALAVVLLVVSACAPHRAAVVGEGAAGEGVIVDAAEVDGADEGEKEAEERKGRGSGQVFEEVVRAAPPGFIKVPAAQGSAFTPQVRLGFTAGDQWEPAIAADRFDHVYVLYPQYGGVPGCGTCASPSMVLLVSGDRGRTWSPPALMYAAGAPFGQWDPQIAVDPADGRTVYASWLQNNKSDVVVARSHDFGATWAVVTANRTNSGVDKPILAVRGSDVYVGYNHAQKVWVSASRDGGATFQSFELNKTGKLGWALAGGGTVTPNGAAYFGWAGYEGNGGAKGKVNLFVSKSNDGGRTWSSTVLDVSASPPDCSVYQCGWAFLGAQVVLASDAAGVVYALWNAGAVDTGPERVYFAKSTDGGAAWSARRETSTAPNGAGHAFPAIAAGAPGDVRISWMDTRGGTLWNTYYRSSLDGGTSWSDEVRLSAYTAGYSYIQPGGFSFPFGDYYEMDIDGRGATHLVWGAGLNYQGPGSIWYTTGR